MEKWKKKKKWIRKIGKKLNLWKKIEISRMWKEIIVKKRLFFFNPENKKSNLKVIGRYVKKFVKKLKFKKF